MYKYQKDFLEFALHVGVLKFGEFKLKSGRTSPYFFNAGLFNSGASLANLGRYYAEALMQSGIAFDMLYGPAYKGIPLAAVTCVALAEQHNRDIPYAFNRKEAKNHGEGGNIVGSPLRGRVIIIDDVITAGTSVRESVNVINQHGARTAGVLIALDRQERGQDDRSAIREITETFAIPVVSIIRLEDIIEFLSHKPDATQELNHIQRYRELYGV